MENHTLVTFQPADYEGQPCHRFSAPGHSLHIFLIIISPYLSPYHHHICCHITTIFVIIITMSRCPIPDYCLNGGTCQFYSTLGEQTCQWVFLRILMIMMIMIQPVIVLMVILKIMIKWSDDDNHSGDDNCGDICNYGDDDRIEGWATYVYVPDALKATGESAANGNMWWEKIWGKCEYYYNLLRISAKFWFVE